MEQNKVIKFIYSTHPANKVSQFSVSLKKTDDRDLQIYRKIRLKDIPTNEGESTEWSQVGRNLFEEKGSKCCTTARSMETNWEIL